MKIPDGWRFKFSIVNAGGDVIVADHTFMTDINEFGACESVDLHVGAALRALRRDITRSSGTNFDE